MTNGADDGPPRNIRQFQDLVQAAPSERILTWTAKVKETYNIHPNQDASIEELRLWLVHNYAFIIPTITGDQENDPFTGATIEELSREERRLEEQRKKQDKELRDLMVCSKYNLTDFGNADRFIRRYGEHVRYCVNSDIWYILDEERGVWVRDEKGIVREHARRTLISIYGEAEKYQNALLSNDREVIAKWAIKCERSHHVQEIISLAMSRPEIVILTDELDSDDWKICLENGVYDLREHRLLPPDPKSMHTRIIPVKYQEGRMAPNWTRFLERIFRGREDKQEIIDYLQRAAGYTLTGSTDKQVMFMLHGAGANGKSVFLEVLRAVMGGSAGYAKVCDSSTFTTARNEGVRNDIAGLAGVRLVTANENSRGSCIDEALIKEITGEREITARFLFKEYFTFRPRFKIWWAFNHVPNIGDNTWSTWRRIKKIPFLEQIPPEEQDPHLAEDLIAAELTGILNWCIEGLKKFQESGLPDPPSVKAATQEYREDQDILHEFISELCDLGEQLHEPFKELYKAYRDWRGQYQERPMGTKRFGTELTEHGFKKDHGRKGTVYHGISLKPDWSHRIGTS
jgi:putative DNA primase/helicase